MDLRMSTLHLKHLMSFRMNLKTGLTFGKILFLAISRGSSLLYPNLLFSGFTFRANLLGFSSLVGHECFWSTEKILSSPSMPRLILWEVLSRSPLDKTCMNHSIIPSETTYWLKSRFFSSYSRGAEGWQYSMGTFATHPHPLVDAVELTVQRVNSSRIDTFSVSISIRRVTSIVL